MSVYAPIQGHMARAVTRFVALGVLAAGGTALVGCGAADPPSRAHASVLRVVEKDFKISSPATVRAGDVQLAVRNPGPDDHELLFVRASNVAKLPMRGDGLTVDEDALERATLTAIEPRPAGTVTKVRLHLTPGRYVMFCNMTGHFRGGMHRTVVAT